MFVWPLVARNEPAHKQENLHHSAKLVSNRHVVGRIFDTRQEVVKKLAGVRSHFSRDEYPAHVVEVELGSRVQAAEVIVVHEIREAIRVKEAKDD